MISQKKKKKDQHKMLQELASHALSVGEASRSLLRLHGPGPWATHVLPEVFSDFEVGLTKDGNTLGTQYEMIHR